MTWQRKEIDQFDMMHLIGMIYANTAVGYKKLGLQTLIEKNAKPPIIAKCRPITKAIIESGILLKEGYGKSLAYKWNFEKAGVPSLQMASMLIDRTAEVLRREKNESRHKKAEKENNRADILE